jgi:hypothetical protein
MLPAEVLPSEDDSIGREGPKRKLQASDRWALRDGAVLVEERYLRVENCAEADIGVRRAPDSLVAGKGESELWAVVDRRRCVRKRWGLPWTCCTTRTKSETLIKSVIFMVATLQWRFCMLGGCGVQRLGLVCSRGRRNGQGWSSTCAR